MWWISAGWMLLIELIAVFGFYLFLLYILGELKDFNKIFA
jgi:hypothetical protein